MIMSGLVMVSLIMLVGENGSLGDMTGVLPWLLSSCFVVWAVVQGRGFGRWLTSVAASKLPEGQPRPEGTNSRSAAVVLVVVLVLSSILLVAFEALAGGLKNGVGEALLRNALFCLSQVVCLRFLAPFTTTAASRRFSSGLPRLRRSLDDAQSGVDHLARLDRMAPHVHRSRHHPTDARGIPADDVHRGDGHLGSYLSLVFAHLKVVNTDNALPIGLAFGYAYAGSVAMLTTVLDDVKTVMMAGHVIVALTFPWLQPTVLRSTMGHAEVVERSNRSLMMPPLRLNLQCVMKNRSFLRRVNSEGGRTRCC